MRSVFIAAIAAALTLLTACGSESDESTTAQQPAQAQQGILTNQQQTALDAANSVQQTLLDSAEQRQKELEARLRAQ